jgi:hypothetical protein
MLDRQAIEKLRQDLGFKDRDIFEKTVYAVNLLPPLLDVYPGLIFKGGTSLLLHQYPPIRLSIDIDILLPASVKGSLFEKLTAVAKASGIFKSVEEDVRAGHIPVPKAHFKFYYDSHFSKRDQYVLLDVVFTESPYPRMIKKPLKGHPLVLQDTDTVVTIPTVEGLFGDKLTVISPKTIGLNLTTGRDMEFLKQIIDLGALFSMISSVDEVRAAFENTIGQENGFRGSSFTRDQVVSDIFDVALKYSQWMVKGGDGSFEEIACINRGLERLGNHLVAGADQRAVKEIFGKIAHILRLLQDKKTAEIVKDIDALPLEDVRFEEKYQILERLRKPNRQAYGYWALAVGTSG